MDLIEKDPKSRAIDPEEISDFCFGITAIKTIETSALTGHGVKQNIKNFNSENLYNCF